MVNQFFFKRKLLWQRGVLGECLDAGCVVLNGNLRNLSSLLVTLLRKLTGRPTINWNHSGGKIRHLDWLRNVHLSLFDGFIAYTESEAERVRRLVPGLPVIVAPNACMSRADCFSDPADPQEVKDLIYVGRLIKDKKVDFLLRGFEMAIQQGAMPETSRLFLVGDGPERSALESFSQSSTLIRERVHFLGSITDLKELRALYRTCLFSVCPGSGGLSLTQSMGFGVPVLVSMFESHGPEIEVCQEGFSAEFFQSDNPLHFSDSVGKIYERKADWLARRDSLSQWVGNTYSFEKMADNIEVGLKAYHAL